MEGWEILGEREGSDVHSRVYFGVCENGIEDVGGGDIKECERGY